jgi:hypothetical protein
MPLTGPQACGFGWKMVVAEQIGQKKEFLLGIANF